MPRAVPSDMECIGRSGEDRPLEVAYVGPRGSRLRILVLAGQHGDEGQATEAVSSLLAELAGGGGGSFRARVAMLPVVNPDGATRKDRENAAGIDLNRDHQLLESREVRAVHGFVRRWRPHLVVDVHTYPPRRKHLLEHGLAYCHDVFFDTPTNPNVADAFQNGEVDRFFARMRTDLRCRGYSSDRYTLVRRSSRVRHSTPDVVDARNGLALRYGLFTVLVEGRQAAAGGSAPALPAMRVALLALLSWATENERWLIARRRTASLDSRAVVRSSYAGTGRPKEMDMLHVSSRTVRHVRMPGPFTPLVRVLRRVRLPRAYAAPTSMTALLDVLSRHGFHSEIPEAGMRQRVEEYSIGHVTPSVRPCRAPRKITVETRVDRRSLENYTLFPVSGDGGHALSVFLEPESKYGLHRYEQLSLDLREGSVYPVLRVT